MPGIELATFPRLLGALPVRLLKLLLVATLAVLAVTTGFVVVAVLTGAVLLILGVRGLWRRVKGDASPRLRGAPRAPAAAADVIEVSATEVVTSDTGTRELKG